MFREKRDLTGEYAEAMVSLFGVLGRDPFFEGEAVTFLTWKTSVTRTLVGV